MKATVRDRGTQCQRALKAGHERWTVSGRRSGSVPGQRWRDELRG